jgi:hypothetical protein
MNFTRSDQKFYKKELMNFTNLTEGLTPSSSLLIVTGRVVRGAAQGWRRNSRKRAPRALQAPAAAVHREHLAVTDELADRAPRAALGAQPIGDGLDLLGAGEHVRGQAAHLGTTVSQTEGASVPGLRKGQPGDWRRRHRLQGRPPERPWPRPPRPGCCC